MAQANLSSAVTFLKGKKSYLLSAAVLIYAVTGYLTGHLDATTAVNLVFGSAGLSTLRAALSNELSNYLHVPLASFDDHEEEPAQGQADQPQV